MPSFRQPRAKVAPSSSSGGMRFTLRPARSDDAPAASRLLAQLGYRVNECAVRVGLERASAYDDAQVIAVTDGDELIGFAALALAPGTGRLEALIVSERRRREGAGRILLAAAEDLEAALTRVFDAVAASGTDDHIVFVEHPDIPGHWRTAPRPS